MGKEYAHLHVAKLTNGCEALDKLSGPGGPFVLWLIDITWCGERAGLRGSGPDPCYVDHQKFGPAAFGQLCGRPQCGAGGRRAIVRH